MFWHKRQINKTVDFIENNPQKKISLVTLADVAHMSKYHFHRLFYQNMSETPGRFVSRVRLERAVKQIMFYPNLSLTDIALDNGFTSSSTFARAFKNEYGHSARAFRNKVQKQETERPPSGIQLETEKNDLSWCVKSDGLSMQVSIEEVPSRRFVYTRALGMYQYNPKFFGKLYVELEHHLGSIDTIFNIFHDLPGVTHGPLQRVTAAVLSEACVEQLGIWQQPPGLYAIGRCVLKPNTFVPAWNVLCEWLRLSQYNFDVRPSYESLRQVNTDEGLCFYTEIHVAIAR